MTKNTAPVWDLNRIFANENEITDAKNQLTAASDELARYKGRLKEVLVSEANAKIVFSLYENVMGRGNELISYYRLAACTDTTDTAKAAAETEIRKFVTEKYAQTAFLLPELAKLDVSVADLFPKHARYWIRHLIEGSKHTLSAELEEYITDRDSVPDLGARLFDNIISNTRFHQNMTLMQAVKALSTETSRSMRRKIYTSVSKGLAKHREHFALMANTKSGNHRLDIKWRQHDTPAGIMHRHNQVEDADIENMRASITQSFNRTSHPFYAWKAKKLGRKQLRPWDVPAPLSEADSRTYSWAEAKDIALACFYGFSEKFGRTAEEFFDKQYIDANPNPEKRIGGFCQAVSCDAPTYILMSWNGSVRDLETLVHELGHGIHFKLGEELGNIVNMEMPLTLAETASVFSEMLLYDWRVKNAADEQEKQDIIAYTAGSKIHTCNYTIAAYNFESRRHAEFVDKGELSADRMDELWEEAITEMVGPALTGTDSLANGWSRVIHFVRYPFYMYAYSFGDCLVNCLWDAYQNNRLTAQHIERLLATGHSKNWQQAVSEIGLNPDDPEFWNNGINVVADMVGELQ